MFSIDFIIKFFQSFRSKNKVIEKNTEYRRDSFDDRVCDDLTEVLISYLSFEDKIRFECLSKQFQDLVFSKQKRLITEKYNSYEFDSIGFFPNYDSVEYDLKAFESVLTKCQSLNDIAIIDLITDGIEKNYRKHYKKVIQLVIKHCVQLKSIQLQCFENVSKDLFELFGRKFGPNLVHIDMDSIWNTSSRNRQTLISLSPNLVSIKGLDLKDLMIGNEFIVLKRLSKLDFMTIGSYEKILFRDFIDKYENQLTSLNLFSITFDETFSADFFANISRLKHLTEFSILSGFTEESIKLFNGLIQIGFNCKQLNKLALNLIIYRDYDSKSFCQSLKAFKNVKILKIKLNSLSFEYFCDGIQIRFPKLESLEFHSSTEVNDNGLKSLAKLKTLKKLTLICYHNSNLTSEGVLHLINSDNQLFYINIKSDFEITDRLIDGLKALTARNPKTIYKINFNFRYNDNGSILSGIPGIRCLKRSIGYRTLFFE